MKDVSVVLKNLKDLLMIKSEIDLREQEARIEKLRKDAAGEEKAPKIEITLGGGLEDYAK
jgi:hypothetical protein